MAVLASENDLPSGCAQGGVEDVLHCNITAVAIATMAVCMLCPIFLGETPRVHILIGSR